MTAPPPEYDDFPSRRGTPAAPAQPTGHGVPAGHGAPTSQEQYGQGQSGQDQFGQRAQERTWDQDTNPTADAAKRETEAVKDTVAESAGEVADSAKDAAQDVAAEAREQAENLLDLAREQIGSQAGIQQQRAADLIQSLSTELKGMAEGSTQRGPLTEAARQGAHKGSELAGWLQNHEPRDVLREARSFAQRRPVTFLAVCGVAGVLAGRLSRAIAADDSGSTNRGRDSRSPGKHAAPPSQQTSQQTSQQNGEQNGPEAGLAQGAHAQVTPAPGASAQGVTPQGVSAQSSSAQGGPQGTPPLSSQYRASDGLTFRPADGGRDQPTPPTTRRGDH